MAKTALLFPCPICRRDAATADDGHAICRACERGGRSPDLISHSPTCYRSHHACAVARVEELEAREVAYRDLAFVSRYLLEVYDEEVGEGPYPPWYSVLKGALEFVPPGEQEEQP